MSDRNPYSLVPRAELFKKREIAARRLKAKAAQKRAAGLSSQAGLSLQSVVSRKSAEKEALHSVYRKEKSKIKVRNALKSVGKVFPDSTLLTDRDRMQKAAVLNSAQYFLGRPAQTTKSLEVLKRRAAKKVVSAKLSTPARRAEMRIDARKAAQKRIRKIASIRKSRRLTPQEVLRLKTDTEAILGVAVPPSDIHRKGMNFLAPKAKKVKLWRKPHMRKKFPQGKRPRKVRQLLGVMKENNLLAVPMEIAEPVLKALLPKIRSRKASPLSVARVLKSPQAKRLAEARKRRAFRRVKMSPYHRQQAKRFEKLMAELKLMQKRLRTVERMKARFVKLNDPKEVALKGAEVAQLATRVASKEAEILTDAVTEAPEVKNLIEEEIAIAISEADLEDLAEEMEDPTEAEILVATDQGVESAFVADSQVASLLEEAAVTIDDAVPAVVAESDTPAIDPDIIDTLEVEQGVELDPDALFDMADNVSVQFADEMITQGANITGAQATKEDLMEKLKANLPLVLIGGAIGYYVLFHKK